MATSGDISAVYVTSPLTGGGASGDVTVAIQAGTTSQSGAVSLTDSTASTSTTTAATPNAVKTAYDLAAAAVPKSAFTAKGDIVVGTGAGTYVVQGLGTTGQVLTVNTALADGVEWTTFSGYSAPTLGSTLITSGATVTTINGMTKLVSNAHASLDETSKEIDIALMKIMGAW